MAKKEEKVAVRPIILRDEENGIVYTLEFDRDSIRFAEARGFVIDDISKYPMSKLPELFFYAFRMHHKNVARNQTDKILYEELGGLSDDMIRRLGELYAEPLNALVSVKDDSEKNSRIKVEM